MVSPLDLSVRPEDQVFELFTHPLEDPFDDLFDQYINFDPFESSQSVNASSASGELDISFEIGNSSSGSEPAGTSPTAALDARHAQSHQPCWSTLWSNQENVALSSQGYQTFIQQQTSDEAAEALSLEGILRPTITSRLGPSSPPSTPPSIAFRRKSKSATKTPKSIRRRYPDVRKSSNCNSSISPKMMRPSHYHHSDSYHEWTERFENFSLDVPEHGLPMSPPPSTRVSQDEKMTRLVVQEETAKRDQGGRQLYEEHISPLQRFSVPTGSVTTPMSQSAAELHNTQKAAMHRRATTDAIGYNAVMYPEVDLQSPQPRSQRQAPWMSPAEHTSEFAYETPTVQPQEWWPATVPQPSHPYYQTATTTNGHASQGVAHMPSDSFAAHGLLISCEPVVMRHSFVTEDPSGDYFTASSEVFHPSVTDEYSPHASPSTPTHEKDNSHLPSSSASASPSAILTPAKTRRASRPSNRRKSCTTTPRTPRTPRTPTSVGFVNFTPSDSKKILTGVAPSGSSKTKARREKEAIEKRRRLSQAAVRAVKQAGGDVEALQAEGLLI
ncbi:hypothetical protein MMC16_004753 [Acarospora aff. strigata]|nr:hypothetical protein [Acarospora aff. strigata]